MSGQPYRYEKDIENFRNEYMEALSLRANLDDMNLQANKNYKETGALPPRSSMKDTRTTAEVLMDVEKLKQSIIGDFTGIATTQMMQLVLQRVQSSPLNGDGSFLIWFAQNAPELAGQLKKKYKFGIAGDANDAENMYLFMQNIYSKTKDMNTTIKSAFDRPIGSDGLGFTSGDFNNLMKVYDDLSVRLGSSQTMIRIKNNIKDQFNELSQFISSAPNQPSKYDQLKTHFIQISSGVSDINQMAINSLGYSSLIEFTDKLPSPSQIRTIFEQIKKSEVNANNELTIKLLNNLSSLLPSVEETRKMIALSTKILQTSTATLPFPSIQLNPTVQPPKPAVGSISPPTTQQTLIIRTLTNKIVGVVNNFLSTHPSTGDNVADDHAFANAFRRDMVDIQDEMNDLFPNWEQTINYDVQIVGDAMTHLTNQFDFNYSSNQQFTGQQLRDEFKRVRGVNNDVMIGSGMKRVGRPKGSGIVKPLHERIDNTKGIKQGHIHVPFGKYLINKNRLDEDIMCFKHIKGYGVKGYPSKRISRNLSNILKTIIGGGVPKFNDLSNLSEEEKNYLHTVSTKAGISDKISVPSPTKDSAEQDIHSFEVMKGEILAGNDSTVLIKKFKLLLLKLSKNGVLPKNEASEIMEDLIQLGY